VRSKAVSILVGALLVLGVAAAVASADDNRFDWSCSGNPADNPCQAGPNHSWGSSTAVNTADAYNKCAFLFNSWYGEFVAGACASATTVRVNSDQHGICPYPNIGTGTMCQDYLYAWVENNTSVHHGLRGVGYY
jgi:hypothetical protein